MMELIMQKRLIFPIKLFYRDLLTLTVMLLSEIKNGCN